MAIEEAMNVFENYYRNIIVYNDKSFEEANSSYIEAQNTFREVISNFDIKVEGSFDKILSMLSWTATLPKKLAEEFYNAKEIKPQGGIINSTREIRPYMWSLKEDAIGSKIEFINRYISILSKDEIAQVITAGQERIDTTQYDGRYKGLESILNEGIQAVKESTSNGSGADKDLCILLARCSVNLCNYSVIRDDKELHDIVKGIKTHSYLTSKINTKHN